MAKGDNNRLKTHCKYGHEFTEPNTVYIDRKTHRQRMCRECKNRKARILQQAAKVSDPEKYKQSARSRHVKYTYNITWEQKQELLAKQNFKCANPGCDNVEPVNDWHVDHDHSCCTGNKSCGKCVRGLLCNGCNTSLGLLKENPNRIKGLASYLEKNNA